MKHTHEIDGVKYNIDETGFVTVCSYCCIGILKKQGIDPWASAKNSSPMGSYLRSCDEFMSKVNKRIKEKHGVSNLSHGVCEDCSVKNY